jgi:hypothetical protein
MALPSTPDLNRAPYATDWKLLYQSAAVSALIMVALFCIQLAVYVLWPPPTSVLDYFTLFQRSPSIGVLAFDSLLLVDELLSIIIVLALYVALRRVHETLMLLATAFSMVAIVTMITARPAVEMLHLSHQYASASGEPEKNALLAAGQVMLALWGGTSFHASYILGSAAFIMVCLVMLRTDVFSRSTAVTGLLSGILGFGLYIPRIGIALAVVSAFALQVYNVLLALRFFRLSRASVRLQAVRPAGLGE